LRRLFNSMDYLWTPWRYQYISNANSNKECVFCAAISGQDDESRFILYRGQHNFIILNIFPYTNGHLMIIPYCHTAWLNELDDVSSNEMMALAKRTQTVLANVYRAHGINLGMNLGEAAGAGVAGHLHLHILPRWIGDSNFMTVVGETRILPEGLETTYQRLKPHFIEN
jgi:ATP adenylyltransferase